MKSQKPLYFISLISILGLFTLAHAELKKCDAYLSEQDFKTNRWSNLDTDAQFSIAWETSQRGLNSIKKQILFNDSLIHALASTVMARQFAWISGPSSGAKTKTARAFLEAELKSATSAEKRNFIFQFNKMVSEGKLIGYPVLTDKLKGLNTIETKNTLIDNSIFMFLLDEIEKANPSTLTSLLSILNERKAHLGSRIVDAFLIAGFTTSNKTLAEFLDSFGDDRAAGEALLDRLLVKYYVFNQVTSGDEFSKIYESIEYFRNNPKEIENRISALHHLTPLIDKVEMSDELLYDYYKLAIELDSAFTTEKNESMRSARLKLDRSLIKIPGTEFSDRTLKNMLRIIKASFLIKQLEEGISFQNIKYKMERKDLVHMSTAALYGGPGKIQSVRFKIDLTGKSIFGATYTIKATLDPYNRTLEFILPENLEQNEPTVVRLDHWQNDIRHPQDSTKNIFLEPRNELEKINELLKNFDTSYLQYEDDQRIDSLLQLDTIPERDRAELVKLKNERKIFIKNLNLLLSTPVESVPARQNQTSPQATEQLLDTLNTEIASLVQLSKSQELTEEQKIKLAYLKTQLGYFKINEMYFEKEHFIDAIFVSLLGDSNLIAFGPPGGAKTDLVIRVLKLEMLNANFDDPDLSEYRGIFLRQFHKLVPEGDLIGFEDIDLRLSTGVAEYRTEDSLVNKRFIFAILDEIEKGNPAVLTTLLSVIREKEVFLGHRVVKSALRLAVMTSNKTPFEFLKSFGIEDTATGKAFLARILNIVYVYNKITDPGSRVQYLSNAEKPKQNHAFEQYGIDTFTMQKLLKKVTFAPLVLPVLYPIYQQFMAATLKKREADEKNHTSDPQKHPLVHLPAQDPAIGNQLELADQLKAVFIFEQLKAGTSFENLNFEIGHIHLMYLANGLLHWAPWKFNVNSNDCVRQIELQTSLLATAKLNYVDERQAHIMESIYNEALIFQGVFNNAIKNIFISIRDLFSAYPLLYPTLIAKPEEFQDWLRNEQARQKN